LNAGSGNLINLT
jgi:hypothetical protein